MTVYEQALEFFNNSNILIYDISYGKCDENWGSSHNYLPFNLLYSTGSAEVEVKTSDFHQVLKPNKSYIVPCNKIYDMKCITHGDLFFIHFSYLYIDQSDLLYDCPECLELPEHFHQKLYGLRERELMDVHDILRVKYLLYEIFFEISDNGYSNFTFKIPRYSPLVTGVFNYIKTHLSAMLTVQEIAQSLGYNPNYLSKKFQEECSITLKRHISSQLYQKALFLLSSQKHTIKQVSQQLMFTDPYYFSKFFKKYHLSSPSSFLSNRKE